MATTNAAITTIATKTKIKIKAALIRKKTIGNRTGNTTAIIKAIANRNKNKINNFILSTSK